MPGSAAVREAIRRLDRHLVVLWLRAPDRAHRGGGWKPKGGSVDVAGPMRGTVCCGDDPDSFYFQRPNQAVVAIRFDQVSMWEPLAPPLPVEQVPRP